ALSTSPATALSRLFFRVPAPPGIYTLSLHDALPICQPDELLQRLDGLASIPLFQPDQQFLPTARRPAPRSGLAEHPVADHPVKRSEEHTSELQSRENLVCRLLLEKKNHIHHTRRIPY